MNLSKTEPKSLTEEDDFDDNENERDAHQLLKNLQPDGSKIPKNSEDQNQSYGDMSQERERNSTFQNFPKQILIKKMIESGYFYTGKGDKTQCHKCHALVEDWNDKDNPASFHEHDCEFYSTKKKAKHINKNGIGNEDMALEDRVPSLLDTPITEPNNNHIPAPVLMPTIMRSRSHGKPNFSHLHGISMAESTSSHKSLPYFATSVTTKQTVGKSNLVKQQVKKVKPKPYNPATGIIDKDQEELLKVLKLNSEEDRRKTFLYKNRWRENTNSVINPHHLAADGFYYLGDLDRTQCFSCDKIFKHWLRSDNVHKVHRQTVVFCKMAQGRDYRNIPIPTFQIPVLEDLSSSTTSSSSNFDINIPSASGLSEELTTSSFLPLFAPSLQRSAETEHSQFLSSASSLQISKSSKQSEDITENEIYSGTLFQEPQMEPIFHRDSDLSHLSFGQALDLTINNKRLTEFSQALHNIKDNSEKDNPSASQVTRPMELETHTLNSKVGQNFNGEAHTSVQPSEEESFLSAESNRSNSPNFQTPTEVSSGHIGQPTTDSNHNSLSYETMEHSGPGLPVSTPEIQSSEMQVSEADVPFPCNDPVYPQMRFAEQRRETYMDCPRSRALDNKEEFISAGFYYNRTEGQLECWYCGGGIAQWSHISDPWNHHAHRYSHCEFVLQQKGPDFVGEASARPSTPVPREPRISFPRFRRTSDSDEYSSNSSFDSPPSSPMAAGGARRILFNYVGRSGYGRRSNSPPPRVVDPREEVATNKKLLASALNSEVTLSAIEMGFDIQAIKKAYKRKIETTGDNFPTTDALLDAILTQSPAESEASEDSDEEEPSSSTAPTAGASAAEGGDDPVQPAFMQNIENLGETEKASKIREYEQEKRCKVCLDRDAVVVFMPCGHLCTCVECAGELRNCPMCRKKIQKSLKIYTS